MFLVVACLFFPVFNPLNQYRSYEKRVASLNPDVEEYQARKSKDSGASFLSYGGRGEVNSSRVERLVEDMQERCVLPAPDL